MARPLQDFQCISTSIAQVQASMLARLNACQTGEQAVLYWHWHDSSNALAATSRRQSPSADHTLNRHRKAARRRDATKDELEIVGGVRRATCDAEQRFCGPCFIYMCYLSSACVQLRLKHAACGWVRKSTYVMTERKSAARSRTYMQPMECTGTARWIEGWHPRRRGHSRGKTTNGERQSKECTSARACRFAHR